MGYSKGTPYTPERAESLRQSRIIRIERAKADPSIVPHGTRGGRSNWGCNCEACVEASRVGLRADRERRKAGTNKTNKRLVKKRQSSVYVQSRPIQV